MRHRSALLGGLLLGAMLSFGGLPVAFGQGASARLIFDASNLGLNKGNGYKTSNNASGTLAWGESYIMMSYAAMFRATGEASYLVRLADHALSVLDQRDNKKGLKDFSGKSRPCWQSSKYSADKKGYCWVVHSGMISYPMADLALLVQQNPHHGGVKINSAGTTLAQAAATVLAEVIKVVANHDFQYKSGPKTGEGYYRGDPAAKATAPSVAGKALPLNQMNAMGRTLVLLWKRTGSSAYLSKAKGLASYLRNRMYKKGSSYVWTYWGTAWKQGSGEDVSHAAINADFAELCVRHGLVFTKADARRLARTLFDNVHISTTKTSDLVDGGGSTGKYSAQVGRWLNLAPYDPRVWPVAANYLGKITKTSSGSVLLGLALVARHAPALRDYFFYYVDWKDLGSHRKATAYGANLLMLPPSAIQRYAFRLQYRTPRSAKVEQWDGKKYHPNLRLAATGSAWAAAYVPHDPALFYPYWKKASLYQLTDTFVAGKGIEVKEVKALTAPQILTTTLPAAKAGAPYTVTLKGSGDAPLLWSVTKGPPEITLGQTSGTLGFSPTAAHAPQVSITVRLTNDSGRAQKTFTLLVVVPKPDGGTPDAASSSDLPPPTESGAADLATETTPPTEQGGAGDVTPVLDAFEDSESPAGRGCGCEMVSPEGGPLLVTLCFLGLLVLRRRPGLLFALCIPALIFGCDKQHNRKKAVAGSSDKNSGRSGTTVAGKIKARPKVASGSAGELMLQRLKKGGREFGAVDLHTGLVVKGRLYQIITPGGQSFKLRGDRHVPATHHLELPLAKFKESFVNGRYRYKLVGGPGAARRGGTAVTVSGEFPRYMTLVTPLPGATGVSRRPKITWSIVGQSEAYALSIVEQKTGKEVVDRDIGRSETGYTLTAAQKLRPNTGYLLQLEAENTDARRASVLVTRFTTGP